MNVVLQVEVPIASFKQSRAREYAETYPVPPPSTVYGMLLSMVGEMDRLTHLGAKIAIGMLSKPEKSTVIRTFRRFKKKEIFDPTNARPDYQELLTGIQFLVWIASDVDQGQPSLAQRIHSAFKSPSTVSRFGGLSLGESRDLVNSISLLTDIDLKTSMQWLVLDEDGLLTLPIWVDHVGSRGTRWQRYSLSEASQHWQPPTGAWIEIQN